MSMHPNAILVASIRPPNGQIDESINSENDLEIQGTLYSVTVGEDKDYDIFVEEGYFAIHTLISNGWGDLVEISEVTKKIAEFTDDVYSYCKANNCTYTIYLSANYG